MFKPKYCSFVKITYGNRSFRTAVAQDSDQPTWENVFSVPLQPDEGIFAEVFHREDNKPDCLLGSVQVPYSSVLESCEDGEWFYFDVPMILESSSVGGFVSQPKIRMNISIAAPAHNSIIEALDVGLSSMVRGMRGSNIGEQTEATSGGFNSDVDAHSWVAEQTVHSVPGSMNDSGHLESANQRDADQVTTKSPGAAIKAILLGPDTPQPSPMMIHGRAQGPDEDCGMVDNPLSPTSGPLSRRSVESREGMLSSSNSTSEYVLSNYASTEGSTYGNQGWTWPSLAVMDWPNDAEQRMKSSEDAPPPGAGGRVERGGDATPPTTSGPTSGETKFVHPLHSSTGGRPSSVPRVLPVPPTTSGPTSGETKFALHSTVGSRMPSVPRVLPVRRACRERGEVEEDTGGTASRGSESCVAGQSQSPQETETEGQRVALVKLAENLAARGNVSGAEKALARAAMLHWQSTESELDEVSC